VFCDLCSLFSSTLLSSLPYAGLVAAIAVSLVFHLCLQSIVKQRMRANLGQKQPVKSTAWSSSPILTSTSSAPSSGVITFKPTIETSTTSKTKGHIQAEKSNSPMSTSTSSAPSSEVITFKAVAPQPGTSKANNVSNIDGELSDIRMGLAPMRTSTPTVTSNVPEELDDLGIQMVQDLLHKHHTDIAGLQFVGYGEFRGAQLPKFACAEGLPFVQILNVGDHWLCVTNVF